MNNYPIFNNKPVSTNNNTDNHKVLLPTAKSMIIPPTKLDLSDVPDGCHFIVIYKI